jgi:hypothetical protein
MLFLQIVNACVVWACGQFPLCLWGPHILMPSAYQGKMVRVVSSTLHMEHFLCSCVVLKQRNTKCSSQDGFYCVEEGSSDFAVTAYRIRVCSQLAALTLALAIAFVLQFLGLRNSPASYCVNRLILYKVVFLKILAAQTGDVLSSFELYSVTKCCHICS